MTHAIRLIGEITKPVARLDAHTMADGARAVIRYPFDGQMYEIVVRPLKEEAEDNNGYPYGPKQSPRKN